MRSAIVPLPKVVLPRIFLSPELFQTNAKCYVKHKSQFQFHPKMSIGMATHQIKRRKEKRIPLHKICAVLFEIYSKIVQIQNQENSSYIHKRRPQL